MDCGISSVERRESADSMRQQLRNLDIRLWHSMKVYPGNWSTPTPGCTLTVVHFILVPDRGTETIASLSARAAIHFVLFLFDKQLNLTKSDLRLSLDWVDEQRRD